MNHSKNGFEQVEGFSLEYVDTVICFYSDFDFAEKGIGCSQREIGRCFKCEVGSGYFTGESINDVTSLGHRVCDIIWCLIIISGVVGIAANIFIIMILRGKKSQHSFDVLLCILAVVDVITCLAHLNSATATTAYFDNWFGRGVGPMYWTYLSALTALLVKSISLFITLLVTVERYIAIAYPLNARVWCSLKRSKILAALLIGFPILMNIPKYSSLYVGPNIYGDQEGGLDLLYMRGQEVAVQPTKLYLLWNGTWWILITATYVVEYLPPFGMLMVFNYLSYKQVQNACMERQKMSSTQTKELQATKMFIPVGIFFFICNIWPIIALIIIQIWNILHRESWMAMLFFSCLNSAVNFWIYYYTGSAFRKDTRSYISDVRKRWTL